MILDVIIIVILGKTVYNGYKNGIISTIFYIIGVLAGLVSAWYFYALTESLIVEYLSLGTPYSNILAMIIPLVLVFFLVLRLGELIKKIIDLITLGFADKFFGMMLGFIKGLIILGFIFFIIRHSQDIFGWEILSDSYIYPFVNPLINVIFSGLKHVIPFLKEIYSQQSISSLSTEIDWGSSNNIDKTFLTIKWI